MIHFGFFVFFFKKELHGNEQERIGTVVFTN